MSGVHGMVPILLRHTEVVSDVAESERKKILAGFQRADRNDLHRVALPSDPKIGNPLLIESRRSVHSERTDLGDLKLAVIGLLGSEAALV